MKTSYIWKLFTLSVITLCVEHLMRIERVYAAPLDLDLDGRSELITTEINSDNSLTHRGFNLTTSTAFEVGSLGAVGDHIAPGRWRTSSSFEIAIVRASDGALSWSLVGSGETPVRASFGSSQDTFMSGVDLNRDGISDAVTTSNSSRRRSWTITENLFGESIISQTFTFGFSNERPLFIKSAEGDLLATVAIGARGVAMLRTYNPVTKQTRRVRLGRAPKAITPLPIAYSASSFGLVYPVEQGDATELHFHGLHSRAATATVSIPAKGTVLIGDFLSDEIGEEVAIHSVATLHIYSRVQQKVVQIPVPSGIAVDEINSNSFVTAPTPPANPAPPQNPPTTGTPIPGVPPEGGLAAVCSEVSPISAGEMLIKSDPSGHIGRHDPRTTGYTVVCARDCPTTLRYTPFYYANGELAGAVAMYGLFSGNGRPRLYGAVGQAPQHDARAIASKAATLGNGKLYISMGGTALSRCKEFAPLGRNGSL